MNCVEYCSNLRTRFNMMLEINQVVPRPQQIHFTTRPKGETVLCCAHQNEVPRIVVV